jgi:pimeloyl-ACP methyl ester carboxylesterase
LGEFCPGYVQGLVADQMQFGNNRGNKYSKKSVHHSPADIPFWDFSMDEFAFHDIPDSINYILETTSAPSLSYIGFSQGTAQAFATLAVHPKLNDQVASRMVSLMLLSKLRPRSYSSFSADAPSSAQPRCGNRFSTRQYSLEPLIWVSRFCLDGTLATSRQAKS